MDGNYIPPLKAIRLKCIDCCESQAEVKLCPVKTCALWPYRFGRNPFRKKREMTEEQKQSASARLKLARENLINKQRNEAEPKEEC